jgi:hypothetical protein
MPNFGEQFLKIGILKLRHGRKNPSTSLNYNLTFPENDKFGGKLTFQNFSKKLSIFKKAKKKLHLLIQIHHHPTHTHCPSALGTRGHRSPTDRKNIWSVC